MNKNAIPTTSRQAFKILDAMLTPEDINAFCAMSASEFSCDQHFGLGMWIRNNWIYEQDEEDGRRLAEIFGDNPDFFHADDLSGRIIESYKRHLRGLKKKMQG